MQEDISCYSLEGVDSPKDTRRFRSNRYPNSSFALYFRWLQPLFAYDQPTIDSHPVSYLLSFYLRTVNNCQYHQIPLLFPVSRTQGLEKQRTGTVDMLYRAVDYLPRTFDKARINPATAMVLPLQAVFYVPPSSTLKVPHKIKQMVVSDVF